MRRIFSSKPSPQRSVGGGLTLALRLTPESEVPKEPKATQGCPCEATWVAWIVKPNYRTVDGSSWWSSHVLESVREVIGKDEYGGFIYADGDRPESFITAEVPYYYDEELPGPAYTFVGAAIGPEVRGVQWSSERVGNEQFDIDIDTTGPLAWVTIKPVKSSELPSGYTNITLTARCGDSIVGVLRLQVRHSGV